jgi:tartrate dehydrogenase/decarboxylase / D-malate dehydrogenase
MKHYKIAAIPADGIGPEVIAAGLQAVTALERRDGSFKLCVTSFDWGSERYRQTGSMMPTDGIDQIKAFGAIFFGAVGAPDVAGHITFWGLRLPGIVSPLAGVGSGDLDWAIVRDNSEGEYSGHGRRAHKGLPEEVGTEVSIFTRAGVTRLMPWPVASA